MTEANQKRLYEHFLATGQITKANEILKVYPQFKEKPISPPKEPETKSKKEK